MKRIAQFFAAVVLLVSTVAVAENILAPSGPPQYAGCVTTEVLVLASAATLVPTSAQTSRKVIEIQVLGPNQIFCAVGGMGAGTVPVPVVNKSRRINADPTTPWALDVAPGAIVKCIAATADQVTGAATVVTECR